MRPLRCPHCDGTDLRRSRRRALELLYSRLGVYPFRCVDCGRRTLHFAPEHRRVVIESRITVKVVPPPSR